MMTNQPQIFLLEGKNRALLMSRRVVQNASRIGTVFTIVFNGAIAVAALVGVLITTLVWREIVDFDLLLNGEQLEGQIISLEDGVPAENDVLRDLEITYTTVTVGFTLRGRPVEVSRDVPDMIASDFAIGNTVEIFYDPANARNAMPLLLSPILLIITVVSWLFFIFPFLRVIRALRRTGNQGVVVLGEVLNSTHTFNSRGNQQSEIWYKFLSPRTEQDVFGDHIGKQMQQLPAPGTQVAVMYYSDRNHKLL